MKRSVIETVLGAIVLILAICFLVFSYKTADVRRVSGYDITAAFSGTGGLAEGDDVRISGVKIGSVNKLALDPVKYLAIVTMSIDPSTKLPDDTSAIISSDSLLGGRYLELQPGGSDKLMKNGDRIQYTQAPQNLEQLLGKFIFSMSSSKDDKAANGAAAANGSTTISAAMPPALGGTAPGAGSSGSTNSVTIPPAPVAATPKKPAVPATADTATAEPAATPEGGVPPPAAASAVPPVAAPAPAAAIAPPPPPPGPAAPEVEPETATPDSAPTALQPAAAPSATPSAMTPPGLPGSESAMPDMKPDAAPAGQPQFSSGPAAGRTTP